METFFNSGIFSNNVTKTIVAACLKIKNTIDKSYYVTSEVEFELGQTKNEWARKCELWTSRNNFYSEYFQPIFEMF
jgi:hypothetical protein